MIDKLFVENIVNQQIDPDSEFLVEVTVSSSSKIMVVVDGEKGITIDRCVSISRAIEQQLDREKEDFELEVASAGLSEPLKNIRQYRKNIGREVSVVTLSGEKKRGKLISVNDENFCIEFEEKELVEGKKRKQLVTKSLTLPYSQVKSTKIEISFR